LEEGTVMEERILEEFRLLQAVYPNAVRDGRWILVPEYPFSAGWSLSMGNIAAFIRDGYPGIGLYGIYTPAGLRFQGNPPKNFTDPVPNGPPFEGKWGMFSWESASWQPAAVAAQGHNLVNWFQGVAARFREGL
jgi:hypothetical protein